MRAYSAGHLRGRGLFARVACCLLASGKTLPGRFAAEWVGVCHWSVTCPSVGEYLD